MTKTGPKVTTYYPRNTNQMFGPTKINETHFGEPFSTMNI